MQKNNDVCNVKLLLMGRMANQLFQFGAALMKYPNSRIMHCGLPIDPLINTIASYNNIELVPYMGWEKFEAVFDDYMQDASLFDEEKLQKFYKIITSIASKKKYDFVIHLRREDYVSNECKDLYYTLSKEYIEYAYKKYYKGGTVAIISTQDGIEWAREQNFSSQYEEESNTPQYDISLIANAKTIICSNSSFSVMGCMINPNKNKVCVIQTPYDKMTDEHDVIIPNYFIKEPRTL